MAHKPAMIALGVVFAMMSGHASAGDTFTGHTLVPAGESAGELTLGGTITVGPPQPIWERAYGTSGISGLGSGATISSDSLRATVEIPVSSNASTYHAALSIRTTTAFREAPDSTGVQIDLMNDAAEANMSAHARDSNGALVAAMATLPVQVAGAVAGTAQVPVAFGSLRLSGAAGASTVTQNICQEGTLLRGNMVDHRTAIGSFDPAALRNIITSFGGYSNSARISNIINNSTNTTATSSTPTAGVTGPCDKPTTGSTTAHTIDAMALIRSGNLYMTFDKKLTATTTWSIPVNFRVTHI